MISNCIDEAFITDASSFYAVPSQPLCFAISRNGEAEKNKSPTIFGDFTEANKDSVYRFIANRSSPSL